MSARVHHRVGNVVVRQVRVTLHISIEGKVEHLHSRKADLINFRADIIRNLTKIFRDDG